MTSESPTDDVTLQLQPKNHLIRMQKLKQRESCHIY
jgi:hypothetical protein